MATRYFISLTFFGDEGEAPEGWQLGAISAVSNQINRGQTFGEETIYDDERAFVVAWELTEEDD